MHILYNGFPVSANGTHVLVFYRLRPFLLIAVFIIFHLVAVYRKCNRFRLHISIRCLYLHQNISAGA